MSETDDERDEKSLTAGAFCPHIKNPHEDCHCSAMIDRNIPLALEFCWENYRQCEIYWRMLEKDDVGA